MAKDYTKNVATAKRLVEKYGRTLTLFKRQTVSAGDPWKSPIAGPADSTTVIGVFVPPGGSGFGSTLMDMAKTLRVVLDQELLIATSSDTKGILAEVDSIEDGGKAWKIHVREELAPGDTSILFSFGVTTA